MELTKKKYKKEEVLELLKEYKAECDEKIDDLVFKLEAIKKEKALAEAELFSYKQKESLINKSLEDARAYADAMQKETELKYSLEEEKLKKFSAKWKSYFGYLKEKYPYYPALKEREALLEKVNGLFGNSSPTQTVIKADELLADEESAFNPQRRINDYISATSDNGFNLEEVLNPGELKLEDLCKELGLMEDE